MVNTKILKIVSSNTSLIAVDDEGNTVANLPLNGNKPLEGIWLLPEIEDKTLVAYTNYLDKQGKFGQFDEKEYKAFKASGGYTEKDMRKAYEAGIHFNEENSETFALSDNNKWIWENFIKSLKSFPTEFEVEMELVDYIYPKGDETNDGNGQPVYEPKVVNNIIQGKYIWK